MDYWQIILALGEGGALVASPCILPVLPFLLSASLTGGRARPYGVILGFAGAFSAIALASRALVASLGIEASLLQTISSVLLFIFGAILFSEKLSARFELWTQGAAQLGARVGTAQAKGFGGGLLVGALIGLVWTPCAGPILAAVLVQALTQQTTAQSVLVTFAFAIGASLPMLLVALFGREALAKIGLKSQISGVIRRVLAVVMMASSLVLAAGLGTDIAALGSAVPPDRGAETTTNTPTEKTVRVSGLKGGLAMPYEAPDFVGIQTWLNSPALTMKDLRGHVVLIDFWTYSCINCVRTLPYITAWDRAYRDKGLVIVGVHAPEFAFERKIENIQDALQKYNIAYPVAVDNNLQTWRAYRNQYWPAHYLIDKEGRVVYTHFGEGHYDETENNIRYLLGLDAAPSEPVAASSFHPSQTPETYLGYARAARFKGQGGLMQDQEANYVMAENLPQDAWSLAGAWRDEPERLVSRGEGAKLRLAFNARKVFLVIGPAQAGESNVSVALNGAPVGAAAGGDVGADSILHVKGEALYELVNQAAFGPGLLELTFSRPDIAIYAFTFGE